MTGSAVERWPDERVEAALAALADELVVPTASVEAVAPRALRPMAPRRRMLAVAAAVLLVVALVVAAHPSTRKAIAGWLGLGQVRVERVAIGEDDPAGLPPFAVGLAPLDVDGALAEARLDVDTLATAGLGRPDGAGRPPEGGVVLFWREGATTLWIRSPGEAGPVEKQIGPQDRAEPVPGVGEVALLIEGGHVLATPVRDVAADRVLWWMTGGVEHRLEADRSRVELVALARSLAG